MVVMGPNMKWGRWNGCVEWHWRIRSTMSTYEEQPQWRIYQATWQKEDWTCLGNTWNNIYETSRKRKEEDRGWLIYLVMNRGMEMLSLLMSMAVRRTIISIPLPCPVIWVTAMIIGGYRRKRRRRNTVNTLEWNRLSPSSRWRLL